MGAVTKQDSEPMRKKPTGRRAGDSGTRDAILDAALDLFAERGFEGASLRAIASQAGVDPALIRHFFGDKETLFATTIADRTAIPGRLVGALHGSPEDLGSRVTDAYLRLWEEPPTRPILLTLVRSATTSELAAQMLREILVGRARDQARIIDDEHMRRVGLAGAHLLGIAIARHVIQLPAVADIDHDTLVALAAPTVQRFLTGGPEGPA